MKNENHVCDFYSNLFRWEEVVGGSNPPPPGLAMWRNGKRKSISIGHDSDLNGNIRRKLSSSENAGSNPAIAIPSPVCRFVG